MSICRFRLGIMLCAALGITAGSVPPASAEGTGTVDFQGESTLSAGLSAPCTQIPPVTTPPDFTVTKGTKTCPPQVAPGDPTKKGNPLQVNGNTRTGSFNSTVACVATVVNGSGKVGNKTPGPKPAAGEGPDCVINAAFIVTGYCGLSQGQGTGTFTTTNPVTGYQNHYWYNFTLVDLGVGNLVLRGNVWKTGPTKPSNPTQLSDLEGVVRATPRPALPGEPENSCVTKTARRLLIVGTVTVTHPKVLA